MAKKSKEEVASKKVSDDRDEQLSAYFKQAEKNYGKGSVQFAIDHGHDSMPRVTTGILPLDVSLGGGLPIGRISMFYGPKSSSKTTCFLRAAGRAQRMCSSCWTPAFPIWSVDVEGLEPNCECGEYRKVNIAWLDVEGVWDAVWSRRFLDVSRLVFSSPETGEVACDMADSLLRSGAVDIVVIDSVAFMTPMAEIERSASEPTMGTQARLLGNMFRKLVSGTNAVSQRDGRRPTVWFTNQIRMKIGVMFGCFHGDNIVLFADGRRLPIRDVVEQRIAGEVLSFDQATNKLIPRKITDWFNNGELNLAEGEHWLSFMTTGAGSSDTIIEFTCTPNHLLFKPDGTTATANSFAEGDTLMSYAESCAFLDPVHRDVILGSLLGESNGIKTGNVGMACLVLRDYRNPEYLHWKSSMLPMLDMKLTGVTDRPKMRSEASIELKTECDKWMEPDTATFRIPADLQLTPLMAAVWYMDNGWTSGDSFISVKKFKDSPHQIAQLKNMLAAFVECKAADVFYQPGNASLEIPKHAAALFFAKIGMHVIPKMRHILQDGAAEYVATSPSIFEPLLNSCAVTITKIAKASKKKHQDLVKYDLEVSGGGSYVIGLNERGVVVHNSPETVPGGMAQGFATSTETRMSPSKYQEDKETKIITSVDMKFRNEKNKTGVAKMEGEYRLVLHDTAVKKIGDVIDEDYAMKMGSQTGLIQLGRGRGMTIWEGQEFESRSLLELYWMQHRDEYEAFKLKLINHIGSVTIEHEATT